MFQRKNILLGSRYIILLIYSIIFNLTFNLQVFSDTNDIDEKYAELYVLDKVSSKSTRIIFDVGKEIIFQNLSITILKCRNSKFDDDPEVTAFIQVIDLNNKNIDKVFVFNDWTFASSPSLKPFDHPIYDIWLVRCYN